MNRKGQLYKHNTGTSMGLFDFFKKKNTSGKQAEEPSKHHEGPSQSDEERFEEEVLSTIPRYVSTPGAEVEIDLRHPETNEVISLAAAYPDQFETWKTVKSLADRRSIIYSILDGQLKDQLELWQMLERLNDDRYAQRALELANQSDEMDERTSDFHSALARTYFILTQYEEAERHAVIARGLDHTSIRAKRIFADILHCTKRHEDAHTLYEQILKEKIPTDKQLSLPIQSLLGFDGDIVNSPIYAMAWLTSDKQMTEETWEWANEEFYYSPHFRSQYAYWLIKKGEHLRGFAKLFNVAKEMPWFKEAAVNCLSLITQLKIGDRMQEEKKWLETLV